MLRVVQDSEMFACIISITQIFILFFFVFPRETGVYGKQVLNNLPSI